MDLAHAILMAAQRDDRAGAGRRSVNIDRNDYVAFVQHSNIKDFPRHQGDGSGSLTEGPSHRSMLHDVSSYHIR